MSRVIEHGYRYVWLYDVRDFLGHLLFGIVCVALFPIVCAGLLGLVVFALIIHMSPLIVAVLTIWFLAIQFGWL